MVIACIISFIVGAMMMTFVLGIVLACKDREPRNKVHFYVARDKNEELFIYLSKPFRGINQFHPHQNGCIITNCEDDLSNFGLNKDDYANLKWEEEPVEVFLNLED